MNNSSSIQKITRIGNRGFSLSEVLISLGLAGLLMIAVTSLTTTTQKISTKVKTKNALEEAKELIKANINRKTSSCTGMFRSTVDNSQQTEFPSSIPATDVAVIDLDRDHTNSDNYMVENQVFSSDPSLLIKDIRFEVIDDTDKPSMTNGNELQTVNLVITAERRNLTGPAGPNKDIVVKILMQLLTDPSTNNEIKACGINTYPSDSIAISSEGYIPNPTNRFVATFSGVPHYTHNTWLQNDFNVSINCTEDCKIFVWVKFIVKGGPTNDSHGFRLVMDGETKDDTHLVDNNSTQTAFLFGYHESDVASAPTVIETFNEAGPGTSPGSNFWLNRNDNATLGPSISRMEIMVFGGATCTGCD